MHERALMNDVMRKVEEVALAGGVQRFAANLQAHGRFGDRHQIAERIVATLDNDAKAFDGKIFRHLAERAARQKLERGFRAVIGVAEKLALLDIFQQARDARILGVYVRRHVEELREVPLEHLAEPWANGADYPKPIVDQSEAREAAIARFVQEFP